MELLMRLVVWFVVTLFIGFEFSNAIRYFKDKSYFFGCWHAVLGIITLVNFIVSFVM